MKRFLYFLLFMLLWMPNFLYAQQPKDTTDALNHLLNHLETYQKNYPQEKIYLHTDRSYYQSGEDIWFKAYVTLSQFNFLSAISKIMYVELLNDRQEVVQSRRLPVVSGLSIGDFKLPETLSEGTYYIRAYTNWMRNFDEENFFHKTLYINSELSEGLRTNSNFSYHQPDENGNNIRGDIQLSDLTGQRIGNRQVAYEIKLNQKTSVKGRSAFDEHGHLRIDFPAKERKNGALGLLTLNIENRDRPPIVKSIPIQIRNVKPTIQLYPEGGTLISGMETKIGFQIHLAGEKTFKAQGYLERDGQQILRFASDTNGTGNFSLTPTPGNGYTAVISLSNGDTVRTNLPTPQDEGYHLAVNPTSEDSVLVKLSASEQLVKHQSLVLLAQTNGMVFYAVKVKLNTNEARVTIPKKILPSGIIQLAMLDDQMDLLAARAIFIMHPQDTLSTPLQTNKKVYARREKVNLTLQMKGMRDSSDIGTFSVAVINATKIPSRADNILSTLLLNTNTYQSLHSTIVDLSQANSYTSELLDNLMLSQPINRTFWSNMREGKFPEKAYKPEKELKISGTITSPDNKPLAKAKVTLVSLQNTTTILDTLTGPDGKFNFDKIIFYNQPEFLVQARDAKGGKRVKIMLDETPNQQLSDKDNTSAVKISTNQGSDSTSTNKNSLDELQQYGYDDKSILLEEVEVKDKKENPAKYSSNLNGPGSADQVISGDDVFLSSCPTLDMCLQGRLTGVIFRGGVPYSTRSPNRPMQIILDGMYMDASSLSTINPFDVASIEVLRTIGNTGIYGMYGNNGVIIITTRRGDQPRGIDKDLYSPGITTFSPQGFYAIRTFQSPDYSAQGQASVKDVRNTIYWQPDIIVDQNSAATLSFYTADEPGTYRITVEGLDINGHLAHRIAYIKVVGGD